MVVGMAWSAVLACSESCALQLRMHYGERVHSIPGWVLFAWALAGGVVWILARIRGHHGRLTTARPDVRSGRSPGRSGGGWVSWWRGSVNRERRTETMNGGVVPYGANLTVKEIDDV